MRKFISANAIPPREHLRTVKIRIGLIESLLKEFRERSLVPHERDTWNEMVEHFATQFAKLYPRSFKHDDFIAKCGGLFWSE